VRLSAAVLLGANMLDDLYLNLLTCQMRRTSDRTVAHYQGQVGWSVSSVSACRKLQHALSDDTLSVVMYMQRAPGRA